MEVIHTIGNIVIYTVKKKILTAAEAAEAADRKLQDLKLYCKRIGVPLLENMKPYGTAVKRLMKRSKRTKT